MLVVVVQEVVMFYMMYEFKLVGKYKIMFCMNLLCQFGLYGGVEVIVDYLKQKLGIGFGEIMFDGKFMLKEGECMGLCGDVLVLLVNNYRMCSFMSCEKIDQLFEEFLK